VLSLVDRQGHPETGFYGLQDIFKLDIQAQLVVLSGCQTALGQEVDGEGLVGMTWGFLYAGARTVVSSLWSVDEAATADFMAAFYSGMLREHLSAAAALRLAQTEISKNPKWSDPFYWAGFTLEGDWHTATTDRPMKSPLNPQHP
jgi:CHAT domain-containing protein